MDNQIKSLLDKTYELEGLLLLALKRKENTPEILNLISKKCKEIGVFSNSLREDPHKNVYEKPLKETNYFYSQEYSIDDDTFEEPSKPVKPFVTNTAETKSGSTLRPNQGKLVFSINDRFRFRKELFENSDIEFNNTVALIASMEDYQEAEDYFINEEGFDISNPIVKEFLNVIKRYFK